MCFKSQLYHVCQRAAAINTTYSYQTCLAHTEQNRIMLHCIVSPLSFQKRKM